MSIIPPTAPIVCMFECLSDNYGYLINHPASKTTICVDSPDSDTILNKAASLGWNITHILNTHWHPDHAGGNQKIQDQTGCTILGPAEVKNRLNAPLNRALEGSEQFKLGEIEIEVLATPGHTLEHISYHLPQIGSAFVGDTLFALGCGRMFEGRTDMFWDSLTKIRALPATTKIYCAHEYTLSNLAFAESIDPDNPDLAAYATEIRNLRDTNTPTVPALLKTERSTNPFLRADDKALLQQLGMQNESPQDVFAAIRKMKDEF